jgi:DNA-binding response OmpR family regulator
VGVDIRVLVVDDATFMRDTMKKALRSGFPGFKLDEAHNGRQAMQLLQKGRYDLVLCDWEMPEMTGAELLQWLRTQSDARQTPFVMVTSRGEKAHVMEAVQLKADNYIVKPYTPDKLFKVVTAVLSKHTGMTAQALRAVGGHATAESGIGLSGAVPIAATLSATSHRPPDTVTVRDRVLVPLRFADATVPCLLRSVSRDNIQGVIRHEGLLPTILDLVVVDLEHAGEVARLNGFVHTLQAREDRRETEFVNITVQLVDQDDAEKSALLDGFMHSLA